MPAFFLALVLALLGSTGGRDQRLVATLTARFGAGFGLLAVAWLSTAISSTALALAGSAIADLMAPDAKSMLVAFVLLLGAAELAWPRRPEEPEEPTRSLFAILLVMLSRQAGDAARFLVFAVSVATGAPVLAAIGGFLGGAASLTLGWMLRSEGIDFAKLKTARLAIAVLFAIAGILIGLSARHILY